MTLGARCVRVSAGQRKACSGVVELGPLPLLRGVAQGAVLRISGLPVIRILGRLISGEMATVTIHRRPGELSADVTGGAVHCGVCACQLEATQAVIELRALPVSRCVTRIALGREIAGRVTRICGLLKIRHMTAGAIHCGARESVANVTRYALRRHMSTRERKARRIVIEFRSLPGNDGVTERAVMWEAGCRVAGILRGVEICHVTAETVCRRTREPASYVTRRTCYTRMSASQLEAGDLRMVEPRPLPAIDGVTIHAIGRELAGDVAGRARLLKVVEMAAHTLRAQSHKDACRRAPVAGVARHCGVRTQ